MADQVRIYQENAKTQIREKFLSGMRKVLLFLSTGGGKTKVFCDMIKSSSDRGRTSAVIVRGRKLVDQASKRLMREGVSHGVFMAGHWNYRPNEKTQVCSIDTLRARNIILDVDLLVIDEAHLFSSDGDIEFLQLIMSNPKTFVVAVTATPYCPRGLRHLADDMVKPTSMQELMDDGYLIPFRYFAPPSCLDVGDIRVVTRANGEKDFNENQLSQKMITGQLSGQIVEHWKELANGMPTIGYAVSITHSKFMAQKFRDAGIPSEHCDADTPEDEREAILGRLESGETLVVWNVGILVTGVDVPRLKALIDASPTMSYNKFVQKYGRLTRTVYADGYDLSTREGRLDAIKNSEKTHSIVLDHAGNIARHGFPTDEPEVNIDGEVRRSSFQKQTKQCKTCFTAFRAPYCPECGPSDKEDSFVILQESDEKLMEIEKVEIDPIKVELKETLKEAKNSGRKPTWAYYKMIDNHGIDVMERYLPEKFMEKYYKRMKNPFKDSIYKWR